MLSAESTIAHYSRSNVSIWFSLAFQAGFLNIGGFLACHRFVSHVTGFATYFGNEMSEGDVMPALGMLAVPAFFLLGSMVSGQLVDLQVKLNQKPKYYLAFGVIFSLILAVYIGGTHGAFGTFGEVLDRPRDYVLLALLCLSCGVQNGTITSVSRSVVRTTHLTGITTDLGLGLVRCLNRRRLPEQQFRDELRANFMRAGIIGFFGLGSLVGGLVFDRCGYAGFAVPLATSGALLTLMLYVQVWLPARDRKEF